MIEILKNINFENLLPVIAFWLIGFLVDLQFGNCKVTERSMNYQLISSSWHILVEVLIVFYYAKFCLDNIQLPVLVFAGVLLWVLGTLFQGWVQSKRSKSVSSVFYFGDGRGNLNELICKLISRLSGLDMIIASVIYRLLLLLASGSLWLFIRGLGL